MYSLQIPHGRPQAQCTRAPGAPSVNTDDFMPLLDNTKPDFVGFRADLSRLVGGAAC